MKVIVEREGGRKEGGRGERGREERGREGEREGAMKVVGKREGGRKRIGEREGGREFTVTLRAGCDTVWYLWL